MGFLKQSTATQNRLIGPFIDDTDGKTAETGLTIANTDIRLSKNGANMAAKNSGGGTHDEAGWYQVTFDATDTATVGLLQVSVHVAGALPVWHDYWVLEEDIYEALFAASAAAFDASDRVDVGKWLGTAAATPTVAGVPEVDLTHMAGVAQSATDLKDFADAGYDPATNKVQGVVLADEVSTLTGHTVQTGDSFARLGAPAGASIAADLVVIDNFVDDLESRLTVARAANLDELGAANIPADIDTLLTRLTAARAALLDEITAARLAELDAANLPANIDAILVDTAVIGAAGAGLTDLGGMSTGMKAEINAEVVDTLNTDTYAEPGQGAPAATASLAAKIGYLYKNWRNKKDQTSTTLQLYADDAATVDQKATVSDDGTTAVKGEIATGP